VRWVCRECGCLYTPGAPCCPDCRATAHGEEAAPAATEDSGEEDEVPKIDRFSVATVGGVTTGHASQILPDGSAAPLVPAAGVKPAEEDAPATVTVAEQKAAGVPPEETVTVAEQKAGAEPPVPPKAPASPTPPARSAPPKRAGNG
jgi:hypothetical protein